MENINAYAYRVYYGISEEGFHRTVEFLFLTEDKGKCIKYLEEFVNKEVAADRQKDDEGNMVNHWWKHYNTEELEVKKGVATTHYNVVIL